MALSLDSIYKPVNDFFLNLFKTDEESPVFFRFDKFGSVISSDDFIDPRSPDHSYSPALAREKFSDLVNSIAIEESDGQNVYFTENNIDNTYRDILLGPSSPFFPEGADDLTKETILTSFSQIKANAIRIWENIQSESSTGLMFKFKPAIATPEKWYDGFDDSIWTSHLFEAHETVTPVDNPSKLQLWRLKITDEQFANVLPSETMEFNNTNEFRSEVIKLRSKAASPQKDFIAKEHILFHKMKEDTNPGIARVFAGSKFKEAAVMEPAVAEVAKVKSFDLHQKFLENKTKLDLKKRLIVTQYVKENAPTKPVSTSSITIEFKYCLVKINRPWYHDSFINNKSWCIPNMAKGSLSMKDNSGNNISILPIGFLAIKNLNISANWTNEDIVTSKNATDFGPFEVSFDSTTNKLSHAGIQIIGWMFQKMPDLPPNNHP